MMVSLIQSNFNGMGSGLMPDGLGFMFQNRGKSVRAAGRPPQPLCAGQAAVPHHHPGLRDQGRRAVAGVRGDGRQHAAAGPDPDHHRPGRLRPRPAGGGRRAALAARGFQRAERPAARERRGRAAAGGGVPADDARRAGGAGLGPGPRRTAASAAIRRSSGGRGAMRRPAKCARMGRRWRTERGGDDARGDARDRAGLSGRDRGDQLRPARLHHQQEVLHPAAARRPEPGLAGGVVRRARDADRGRAANLPLHGALQGLSRRAGADGEPAPRLVPQLPRPPLAHASRRRSW